MNFLDPVSPSAERAEDRFVAVVSVYPVKVEWGDCDPAQIVFYPKYFAWFDAATHGLFEAARWPQQRLIDEFGIVGVPIAEASARFLRPSRVGDRLEIRSRIVDWQDRRFTVLHEAYRGDTLLLEGREVRFCGQPHPSDPERLVAIPIPEAFKKAFDA